MKNLYIQLSNFLFLVTLITIFLSCDDNSVGTNNSKTVTGFYGKLYNYNSEENIFQSRLFLDSGFATIGTDTISSDSILNVDLLTPDQTMLKPIREITLGYDPSLNVSNPEAMATDYLRNYFFNHINGGISGYLVRSNSQANSSYYEGLYTVNFAYCDRATTVSGNIKYVFSIFGPEDTIKYNVNVNLTKGWNPVTYKTKYVRTNYYEYDVYVDDAPESKWFYHDDYPNEYFEKNLFPFEYVNEYFEKNLLHK